MDLFESSKQFLEEYYPRDHLLIAGVLSLIIVIFLAIPNDGDNTEPSIARNRISVPISPAIQEGAQLSSSAISIPQQELSPETPAPIDDAWQTFVIKSGDNLSEIFFNVGLTDQDLFRVLDSSDEAQILNRVYPGYELGFLVSNSGELDKLQVLKNPLEGFISVSYTHLTLPTKA